MVLISCVTPPGEKSSVEPPEPTEPKVITKTEYLPGDVVIQPLAEPDSSLVKDCDPLTEDYIPDGPDIDGKGAVATATAWASQYRECEIKYYTLRGWIIGVRDGQLMLNTRTSEPP